MEEIETETKIVILTDAKSVTFNMTQSLKDKIIEVCNKKIAQKGDQVGVSFYAFFKNKNDNPVLLMEAAKWWIETEQLDHFEKAVKVKNLIENL